MLLVCAPATSAQLNGARGIAVDGSGNIYIADTSNNRIRMVPTDPDSGPIERSDLVKGYEVSKEEYVLMDDADFEKVKLDSTRTISIDRFVDAHARFTSTTRLSEWGCTMSSDGFFVPAHLVIHSSQRIFGTCALRREFDSVLSQADCAVEISAGVAQEAGEVIQCHEIVWKLRQ